MTLDLEDVQKILAIVEQSHFTEVDLRVGDVHLTARKGAPARASTTSEPDRTNDRPQETHRSAAASTGELSASSEPAVPVVVPTDHDDFGGNHVVRAPMVGTFYRAPSSGAEPFANEGDVVSPTSTLGSIEVMKLYNSVEAGVHGTVVKFLVENNDLVEFGQPLVVI